MNQKGFAPIFLLIWLLIIALIGGGVYYFETINTNPLQPAIHPAPSQSTLSQSDDQTANWHTYTNNRYGFSLRYPSSFTTDCCAIGLPLTGNPVELAAFAEKPTIKPGTDAPFNGFIISIDSNRTNIAIDTYIVNESQALSSNLYCGGIQGKTQKTINSYTFTVLTCKNAMGEYILPVQQSNKIIIFSYMEVISGSFIPSFDQILSTITFTK